MLAPWLLLSLTWFVEPLWQVIAVHRELPPALLDRLTWLEQPHPHPERLGAGASWTKTVAH